MIELRWLDRRGTREHAAGGGPDFVLQYRSRQPAYLVREDAEAGRASVFFSSWQDVPTVREE